MPDYHSLLIDQGAPAGRRDALAALMSPNPALSVRHSLRGDFEGSDYRAALINALFNHANQLSYHPPAPVPLGFGQQFPASTNPTANAKALSRQHQVLAALLAHLGY